MRTMKENILILILIIVFISCSSVPAKKEKESKSQDAVIINHSNYYDYYSAEYINTSWIEKQEAISVILEELYSLDIYALEFNVLYELPCGNRIVLDIYSQQNNSGIVYNTGHFAEVKQEQREIKEYTQRWYLSNGNYGQRETYDSLPSNIIVLQETWYWYQVQKKKQNLISKEDAIQILKSDIHSSVSDWEVLY